MGEHSSKTCGLPGIDELDELRRALGPEAWARCSDVAQVVACYLSAHPRVALVRYPGLRTDPLYQRASCVLERGFGPLVAWRDPSGVWRLFDSRRFAGPREAVGALEVELAR